MSRIPERTDRFLEQSFPSSTIKLRMATKVEKPKPYRYKSALEKMAEDVRDQIALEKFQEQTGITTAMIDRVRAKSYRRLALELQRSLGIDLGVPAHKF